MNEEKDTFVSRHGRKTALTESDLNGLLDDGPVLDTPSKTPRRKRRNLSRRQWLIIAGIIVIIVLVPVIIGEILKANYDSSAKTTKSSISSLISKTVLPDQKKANISADTLADIATKLESVRDQTCPGGILDNMANLYPRAHSAYQRCIDERSKVAQLANSVRDLEKEARYMQSLSVLLTPLLPTGSNDFAVIGSQQTNWQDFQTHLKTLSPPPTLLSTHVALLSAVGKVTTGWSNLNTASNAKDSKGFTDAQTALASAYQSVRDISNTFDNVIAKTQASLSQLAAGL